MLYDGAVSVWLVFFKVTFSGLVVYIGELAIVCDAVVVILIPLLTSSSVKVIQPATVIIRPARPALSFMIYLLGLVLF